MTKAKRDFAQNALRVVEEATQSKLADGIDSLSQDQVRKFMREIGRRGGLKGGRERAAKLTDQQKSESASKAARARWSKEKAKD